MYDLIVIGGGPGGYTGAIRAAKSGMKVALIEKDKVGGTCLNRGCIPTKALLKSAELFESRAEWQGLGVNAENVTFDETKAYENKQNIVTTLNTGVLSLVKANKIDFYEGHGCIEGEHTVSVNGETLETKFILLATGSVPAGYNPKRPVEGIETAYNSDNVLGEPIDADDIIIIGAGVIAIEFAYYYSSIGKKVTVLAPKDRILTMAGKDTASQLGVILKKKGVKIITGASPKRVDKNSVTYETNGKEETVTGGAVIAAVGRNAVTEGIGLENVGVAYDKFVKVDENMYTGVAGIYACGDLTGKIMLAHYAAASAITAVESMLGKEHSMNLEVCPSCIYTLPEIAMVGAKETDDATYKTTKFLMGGNGKALIEGCAKGFIKLVTDAEDTVVGAELFCVHATDMVGEIALAIAKKMKVHEVAEVIHPHPTVMEAMGEALEEVHGMATHAMPRR